VLPACSPCTALYCLQYYQDTLDATITQLKSEGKYDSGIVTIKVGGWVVLWVGGAVGGCRC
jgi:hypothetical protein